MTKGFRIGEAFPTSKRFWDPVIAASARTPPAQSTRSPRALAPGEVYLYNADNKSIPPNSFSKIEFSDMDPDTNPDQFLASAPVAVPARLDALVGSQTPTRELPIDDGVIAAFPLGVQANAIGIGQIVGVVHATVQINHVDDRYAVPVDKSTDGEYFGLESCPIETSIRILRTPSATGPRLTEVLLTPGVTPTIFVQPDTASGLSAASNYDLSQTRCSVLSRSHTAELKQTQFFVDVANWASEDAAADGLRILIARRIASQWTILNAECGDERTFADANAI